MYFNQTEFGKRIREERIRLGLTQEDLAFQLNIGHVHMNSIERGRKGCSIDLLLELSDFLGVSTDYLLTGKSSSDKSVNERLKGTIADLTALLDELEKK